MQKALHRTVLPPPSPNLSSRSRLRPWGFATRLLGCGSALGLAASLAFGQGEEGGFAIEARPDAPATHAKRADGSALVSPLAGKLPFAYSPSHRELEVACDAREAFALYVKGSKPDLSQARALGVKIFQIPGVGGERWGVENAITPPEKAIIPPTQAPAATGSLPLDAQGRGQGVISLPELPEGEFVVEYTLAGERIRSPKTFLVKRFGFEGNRLGAEEEVYPPFEPVRVNGTQVSIVGRSYTVNALGLLDRVTSQGRELLAAPMRLLGTDAEGKPISWNPGTTTGKALSPCSATFSGSAQSAIGHLKSEIRVEEDGCARVEITLAPEGRPVRLRELFLEIPLRDAEARLFHFCADNAMRWNYAGELPRGGRPRWDLTQRPIGLTVEPGPADGLLWDSSQVGKYTNPWKADTRIFVPYLWVGSEERGLAWFAENERGWGVAPAKPFQAITREGDRVVLRIWLVNQPTEWKEPRTFVFGLQASPTKPLEKAWRTREVATGIGPVNCWGSYDCPGKYPDGRDFTIVDKIQEARRTGKVDEAWFREKDQHRVFPDLKVHGKDPWLTRTLLFAQRAAERQKAAGTYFEEHNTEARIPETLVYQDEWSRVEFVRFQDQGARNPQNFWGGSAPSHADFALFYANEWLKRGVSLYFDNTYPKRSYNRAFGGAWYDADGTLRYNTLIWGPRAYYRRMWKLVQSWNRRGAPYPLDLTYHMTNTQWLPATTWSTALLDMEHKYWKDEKDNPIPWPADYLRTVTMSRTAGSIPFALDPLRNGGHTKFYGPPDKGGASEADQFADWAMRRIHEVRAERTENCPPARRAAEAFEAFGYGAENVEVHNYWAEAPLLQVEPSTVKWIALVRRGDGRVLVLLQSWSAAATEATLRLSPTAGLKPDALQATDALGGSAPASEGAGAWRIPLPPLGTRLLDLRPSGSPRA